MVFPSRESALNTYHFIPRRLLGEPLRALSFLPSTSLWDRPPPRFQHYSQSCFPPFLRFRIKLASPRFFFIRLYFSLFLFFSSSLLLFFSSSLLLFFSSPLLLFFSSSLLFFFSSSLLHFFSSSLPLFLSSSLPLFLSSSLPLFLSSSLPFFLSSSFPNLSFLTNFFSFSFAARHFTYLCLPFRLSTRQNLKSAVSQLSQKM